METKRLNQAPEEHLLKDMRNLETKMGFVLTLVRPSVPSPLRSLRISRHPDPTRDSIVVPSLRLGRHKRTGRCCRTRRRRRSRYHRRQDGYAIVVRSRPALEAEPRPYGLEPGGFVASELQNSLESRAASKPSEPNRVSREPRFETVISPLFFKAEAEPHPMASAPSRPFDLA